MEHFGQVMERPLTPHGIDFVFVGSKSLIHLNILENIWERDPTRTCHFSVAGLCKLWNSRIFFFYEPVQGRSRDSISPWDRHGSAAVSRPFHIPCSPIMRRLIA